MARIAHIFRVAGVALAALLASPASAEVATPGAATDRDFAKSSAILGGKPSALEAILSSQAAGSASATAAIASATTLRPASLSRPLPRAPGLPSRELDDVASGKPDVFGTVALKLARSRLNSQWKRAHSMHVSGKARDFARDLQSSAALERIERINRYVNGAIEFTDDSRQFGRSDVWSSPSETLRRGRGDCEDYAIVKLHMLREAGFDRRDLYFAVVKDLVRRQDHAVLLVRSDGHFYLLDNSTDTVLDSNEARDYRPVLTFSADGVWTHGYRVRRAAPVDLAETDARPEVVLAAANDQRSRSASFRALSTGFKR